MKQKIQRQVCERVESDNRFAWSVAQMEKMNEVRII